MKVMFGAVVAASLSLAAGVAPAVTVSQSQILPTAITDSDALLDPTSVSGFVRVDFAGSSLGNNAPRSLSPFAGTSFENTALYHAVSANSEARYLFDSAQRQFSLLFGSPDAFNRLSFWLDGVDVFGLTGADLLPANQLGKGALMLLVSDIIFDEVRMASSRDSFEFSNVASLAVTSTPVPAPLAMLLASLVGLAALANRRSASTA
jgi:hypothetical protein